MTAAVAIAIPEAAPLVIVAASAPVTAAIFFRLIGAILRYPHAIERPVIGLWLPLPFELFRLRLSFFRPR